MMKKNKLYTVNKWNREYLGEAVEKAVPSPTGNLFWGGGDVGKNILAADKLASQLYGANYGDEGKTLSDYMSSTNAFGISKADNPFSKMNMQGGLGAMANTGIGKGVLGAVGGLGNQLALKGISSGLSSGVGNGIAGAGNTIGGAIGQYNPVLGTAIQLGTGTIGGAFNALGGTSVDEKKKAANDAGTAALNNFTSNAESFDDVKGPQAVANVQDAHKSGAWRKGWARKRNAADREARENARAFAENSVKNNIYNITQDQLNDALANYAAFGGPLDYTGNDMGAIEYNFMDRYLTAKEVQNKQKNQALTNLFAGTPSTIFDLGGVLQTHGSDFSDGLITINAGGTHEESPYDGVQMGVDPQGVPNLVEEGEAVYDDYVFSNRIKCDTTTKEKFHLPKKKDITYADLAKKLEKEIQERPNDPISKAGFKAQMGQLEEQQERQKSEMEAERAKAAFEALSPEEKVAVMQQTQQQEQAAQETAMQEQAMAEQQAMQAQQMQGMPAQGSPEEMAMQEQMSQQEAPVMAEGGPLSQSGQLTKGKEHLFPWGGYTNLFSVNPPYSPSNGANFIPYDRKLTPEEVMKLEQEKRFIDWTNYVNEHWEDEYVQNYLKALDKAAGGNHLFDKDGKLTAGAKDYFNNARTKNHLWGYYHLTPEYIDDAKELQEVNPDIPTPRGRYTPTAEDINKAHAAVLNNAASMGVPAKAKAAGANGTIGSTTRAGGDGDLEVEPSYRAEWPRYMGLFGPAVGLGLQLAGVGKPDTSGMDNALAQAARSYHLATNKYLGNYMRYKPLDTWFHQAKIDAQARATDRNILNTSGGNRGTAVAGMLANGLNSQIASGENLRQDNLYNRNDEFRTEEFNRGTDEFNAKAFNDLSRFNTSEANRAAQFIAQMNMQAARDKADLDAGWYNSLYGNIGGLFKGISDLGRENAQHNMIAEMAANGIFGTMSPKTHVGRKGKYLTWKKK